MNHTMQAKCILCGNRLGNSVYRMEHVPTIVQNMSNDRKIAKEQKIDLNLYECNCCGLFQFDCEAVHYYKDVVRAGGLSSSMRLLRQKQFEHLVNDFNLKNKKIVEIGAGRGEFLTVLKDYGVECYGIECNDSLVKEALKNDINMVRAYSDDDWKDARGPFDAFISFNYLEHQPDPNALLRGIYNNTTDNAIGLFTVPSFEYFIEEGAYYEFMRDHLAYYTEESLSLLFQKNGFQVLEINRINGDTTQIVVSKRKKLALPNFDGQRGAIENALNDVIDQVKPKKIAVWGASHQGLTLLSTLKLNQSIEYIVDSAPFKWSCFSPVSGLEIKRPEFFFQDDIDMLIIMAPAFAKEICDNVRSKCAIKQIYAIRDAKVVNMMEIK